MADNTDDGLGYGHLGDAIYNPDQKRWNFQRPLESVLRVEALGPSQTIISSPSINDFTHEPSSAALRKEYADNLCKDDPDIAPSRSLLPGLARLSSSVIETTTIHDPLVGPLFAIGSTRDETINARVSVAVFVSDASQCRLAVVKLETQKQGWADSKDSFIRVPQLSGERGEWLSPSPIRQVLGAGAAGHADGVFAVRSARGTYLLHIKLGRTAVGRTADERASRFAVSVRGFIPLDGDRRSLHADVAINPWSPTELAVVDVAGRWQVHARQMQIHHVGANDMTYMTGSRIKFDIEDAGYDSKTQQDGWMKVTWIGDKETLLLCSRRSISIANLRSGSCNFVELEIGAKREDLWFQDLRLDPYHLDRCFILTHTFIYCVRVAGLLEKKSQITARTETLVKFRHCRDSADPSLRLSLSSFDSGTMVMITSSSSALSTLILFNDGSGSDLLSTTVSSMAMITDSNIMGRSPTQNTVLLPATWDQVQVAGIVHDLAEEYRQRGVSFWTTFSLHQNAEVTQRSLAIRTDDFFNETIQAPQWKNKAKLTPARLPNKAFVVDDDEVDVNDSDEDGKRRADAVVVIEQRRRLRRSFELQQLYQKLVDIRFVPDDDVTAVLSKITTRLSSAAPLTRSKLLINFVDKNLQVGDLDEANDAFLGLQQASGLPSATAESTIVPIAGPSLLQLHSPDGNFDIRSIYSGIVSTYLSPLSPEIPGRVRLAREQLARRIAAQLTLSSYKTPSRTSEPDSPSQHQLSAALSRLSRLTPTAPLPSVPKTLSSSATGILAHWNPGTDPKEYDFKATRLRLQRQREERDDPAMAERRRRKRLKMARRSASGLATADPGSSQALFSSQVQGAWGSSQVQPGWLSSQAPQVPGSSQVQTRSQQGSSQTVAGSSQTQGVSQGVPVRKKVKVKKRTQGF